MTYKDLVRRLKSLGCEEVFPRTRGSHRQWHNTHTRKSATIPDHGSKDLKKGTIRGIVRRLGIKWHEFNNTG